MAIATQPTLPAALATGNTETLTGDLTLAIDSADYQFLDPNGADRVITLPDLTGTSALVIFVIKNTGTANILTVQDSGSTQIGNSLAPEVVSGYAWDGTEWQLV